MKCSFPIFASPNSQPWGKNVGEAISSEILDRFLQVVYVLIPRDINFESSSKVLQVTAENHHPGMGCHGEWYQKNIRRNDTYP